MRVKKDVVTKDIISVTSDIEKVRKEIRLCDEVGDNYKKMKEKIKEMKEMEQENAKEKEDKILKKKKRQKV